VKASVRLERCFTLHHLKQDEYQASGVEQGGSVRISLLDRQFRGSCSELLVNLLENERIDATELRELERLIRNYRKASISRRQ
jgi:hypothetical protein